MNSIGKLAELKACDYLQKKKYVLLEANYRSRFGEIDLIMKNKKYLCFIEVKMRNENSLAAPSCGGECYCGPLQVATMAVF